MSTSESGTAAAQLDFIRRKNNIHPLTTCGFAYGGIDNKNEYICMDKDGKLYTQWINTVTRNDSMYGSGFFCEGIALKHIAPSTNVQEAINNLEQSQLVADLRDAMANGKFAPIVPPFNPPSSK